MRVIAISTLKQFWKKHPLAEQQLKAWYQEVKSQTWKNPADIKRNYITASILKNDRVVFNIKGNRFRLIVKVNFKHKLVYIRFIGTHSEYDKINAEEI